MNEQRLHSDLPDGLLRPRVGGDNASASAGADRLSNARGEVSQLFAAADAILDRIRQGNSTRFLEQIRQSGGE